MASKIRAHKNNLAMIVAQKSSHRSIGTVLLIPKMYSNIENTH